MVTNYYTLFQLVAELRPECSGKTIREIFTQHRGELIVSFSEIPSVLVINCEPSGNSVYLHGRFARARRNSLDLLPDATGLRVERVVLHPSDREISFILTDRKRMFAQLFGSKANVYLANSEGTVIDSFLKKGAGDPIDRGTQPERADISSPEHLRHALRVKDGLSIDIQSRLKAALPQFGNVLLAELLYRSGLNGNQETGSLQESDTTCLVRNLSEMKSELTGNPTPRIYYDGPTPIRFSIIALRSLERYQYTVCDSVSEGIRVFIGSKQRDLTLHRDRDSLEKSIAKELEHIEHTLKKIESEAIDPAVGDDLEMKARLLMAHLPNLQKGMREVSLTNILLQHGPSMTVALDVHLSPAKNAERYFQKAKKARRTIEEQYERKQSLSNRRVRLQSVAAELALIESNHELEEFKNTHRKILEEFGYRFSASVRQAKEQLPPFRIFTVAGGFQVWAGKSGENNDLLTTRHTAKSDLWFHARGVGGSHVVLKVGTGKGEVSKRAIEEAAAIAAYYSKMKNSKLVPVTMCEGKFVRKLKGAPAGTVAVEREKTVFVVPGLPA